jgi:large subunit ribosomal protein L47
MRAIKHTLTERFYTWEDAVKVAETDPEINLSGDGPAFTPIDYLEEGDAAVAEENQAAEVAEETAEKTESGATATPDPTTIPASKTPAEAPRL